MLLDRLKILSKESLIYGLSSALSGAVSFLLLPLYAHALSPGDYGYLIVLTVFQTVMEITIVFGLSSALFRYYLMANSPEEKQQVLNTSVWTQFIFIFLIGLAVIVLSNQVSGLLLDSSDFAMMVVLIALTACTSSLHTLVQSIMRAERRPFLYLMMQALRVLLSIALNIYFVVAAKMGFEGVIYGNLIATVLSVVPFILWVFPRVSISFSVVFFFKIIRFSGPIYLANLFYFILSLSDRLFLNYFLTEEVVGIYSFGSKIGSIVMIGVITPFSLAVVPFVISMAHQKDFKTTFIKIVSYFFITITSLSLVIFFFSTEIISLIATSAYDGAITVIGPVLLASIFYGLYYMIGITTQIIEKTHFTMIAIGLGAMLGIVLNIILIPIIGIYGALISNCVANLSMILLIFLLTQKSLKLNYEFDIFAKMLGLVSVNVFLFFLAEGFVDNTFLLIATKVVLLAVFVMSLFWAKVIRTEERNYINKIFESKFR